MKKTITLILLTISIVAFAQKNKDIEIINNKIENINQKVDEINNKLTTNEVFNKEKQNLYKEKFEQVNSTVKEAKEREDRFLTYIQWFFTIVGGIFLIFVGSSFWEFRRNLKKINNDATQRLDNISEKIITSTVNELKSNSKYVKEIVDNNIWEFRLMAKAHIMIVNPIKDDDAKNLNPVLKFFEEKGAKVSDFSISFDNPDKIKNKVNNSFDTDRFNIVLLENSDGNWNLKNKTNELNAAIIAKGINKKAMLVYFGPGNAGFFPSRPENYYPLYDDKYSNFKIQEKTLSDKKDKISEEEKTKLEEIREKIKKIVDDIRKKHIDEINSIIDTISFANTPSKLYPNLIDALKYLDIIDPDIDA